MTKLKEVINLEAGSNGFGKKLYKVRSLTNRLTPSIGDTLELPAVEKLLDEARHPTANLTVNIK
jgi:hypothetical protein